MTRRRGALGLVLMTNDRINDRSDFETIARRVEELDPGIRARVFAQVPEGARLRQARRLVQRMPTAVRPTLVIAPHRHDALRPIRGVLRSGNRMSKAEEVERLRRSGVPIPDQVLWTESDRPAIDHLGNLVIVKPSIGTRAEDLTLQRTEDVEWKPIDGAVVGDSGGLIIQRFVDTHPAPSFYRVLTMFGAPLYCERIRLEEDQRPIRGSDPASWRVIARGDDKILEMVHDADVVDLAVRASAPFDDVPLCGVDVVRDARTGELFVLEMNTWGYVWHLSSPNAAANVAKYGIDMYGQYGALEVAAARLAEKTRELLG